MEPYQSNEVADAFCDTGLTYTQVDDKTVISLTAEFDMPRYLVKYENLVKRVLKSQELNYSLGFNKRLKTSTLKSSRLGADIILGFSFDISSFKNHYPIHQFNPYIDLYFRLGVERSLFSMPFFIKGMPEKELVRLVDILNEFIEAIRIEGNSKQFKLMLNDFKRSSNKNYRELLLYIKQLFKKHSRLLVLRIDFGYKKELFSPNATETPVSYDEFRKHRELLFRHLSSELPNKCMVGYAWKMEYGLDKSYHIHAMLFLDGSKVREDVTIARIIGEHWNADITEGKGLYYNCNAFKGNYKSCGIGMINYHETASYEGLRKAALYMTKPDYYIRVLMPENGRSFGKGIMPEENTSTKGRPRSKLSAITD
jgi:hypothetical protein